MRNLRRLLLAVALISSAVAFHHPASHRLARTKPSVRHLVRAAHRQRHSQPLLQIAHDLDLRAPSSTKEDDGCFLLDPDELDDGVGRSEREETLINAILLAAPILLPIFGGLSFETNLNIVHSILEWLANSNWVQVDGGLSRTAALLPVLTGIVLPCVSFALGTLTATTISTLRARQVQLRSELNQEACLIRSLLSATEAMFPPEYCADERAKAALLLRQYCTRVLVESRSGINLDELARQGAANSELDGVTRLLHNAKRLPDGVDPDAVTPRFSMHTEFLAQMYVEKLQITRSERLAVLQTTFPFVHWFALTLLGISIVFGFLLAADQQTLLFLAPVQLRLLFSVLVGALTATACICADLNDPFRGAFQITPSSEQFDMIRSVVDQTLNCNDAEALEYTPPPARTTSGSTHPGSLLNFGDLLPKRPVGD